MRRFIITGTALLVLGSSLPMLAEEDPYASVRDKIRLCESCHGEKGASSNPQYPIIAGQEMYYIYVQLKDFKARRRDDPIMSPVAEGLEKEQMKLVATYFSEQEWPETDYTATEEERKTGLRMVASAECPACHLGGFRGNSRVPRLAGQHRQYLEKTMFDFKYRRRLNARPMNALFETFEDADIVALAKYISSIKLGRREHGIR